MKKFLIFASLIYFISCKVVCGDNNYPVDSKADCYSRDLTDAENNNCCFMEILHTSNITNFACFESPKTWNDDGIKDYMNKVLPEMNYTLVDFSCPKEEDPNKEYFCGDNKVPKGSEECFSRTLVDRENNQCCYYKLSGKFGDYIGCSEVPTVYSKSYIKEKYFKEYIKSDINFEDLLCPNDKETTEDSSKVEDSTKEEDTTKKEDTTKEEDTTQQDTLTCSSSVVPAGRADCFSRETQEDKNKFYCCYIRVTSKVAEGFSVCSEYQKEYKIKDVEETLRGQYSAYGYDLEEFYCPGSGETTVEPGASNSTQGNSTLPDEPEPEEPKPEEPGEEETKDEDKIKESNGFYLKSSLLLILAFLA